MSVVCFWSHLHDAREVAKVEEVVRLGGRRQEVGDRLLKDVGRRRDYDLKQTTEVHV